MKAPRLLQNCRTLALPDTLFSDLQIDKILSSQAIAVLRHPCEPGEMVRRNELFLLLDKSGTAARIEKTQSVLCAAERALYLRKEAKIPLEQYYRHAELFEAYVKSCEALASMHDLGELFADAAEYYSSGDARKLLSVMKDSVHNIRILLSEMSSGLLSFADKSWLTPDCDVISEIAGISGCAVRLGFTVPKQKKQHTKISPSLADAVCRLYADKAARIEAEIAKYADIDFGEPCAYIPELRFFLEIYDLLQRAAKSDVPHTIAKIADAPQYSANALYDVSLLAKNCEGIVPNGACITPDAPFCFLLGANGGGKTTYLRALGVNLVLFLAGCPVFAKEAEIYPFDLVLSHFPRDERFDNTGRLDEERKRAEEMLHLAENRTPFLLFNETFSGTDDKRGFDLLTEIAAKIDKNNYFGLYVTHFHEVMSLDYPVLSAEVDLTDANRRTFRIVRSKGSASSYAADILKKYRLDKESLEARRGSHGN